MDLPAVGELAAGIFSLLAHLALFLEGICTFTLALPLRTPGGGTLAAPEWPVQVDRVDRRLRRTVP